MKRIFLILFLSWSQLVHAQFEDIELEGDFPDSLSNFERLFHQSVFEQLNEWQNVVADSTLKKISTHIEIHGSLLHANELIQVNNITATEIALLRPYIHSSNQPSDVASRNEIIALFRTKKEKTPGASIIGKWNSMDHHLEFHAEVDPGELPGKRNNAAFFTYMYSGKWKWQVGDFLLRSPMGLIQYYSPRGFNSFGRLTSGGIRFTPHRSWNEDIFLRGINLFRQINNISFWGFVSSRKRKLSKNFDDHFFGWNNSNTLNPDTHWWAIGAGAEIRGKKTGLSYGWLLDILQSLTENHPSKKIPMQFISYHASLGGVLVRGEAILDQNSQRPQFSQEVHFLPFPDLKVSGTFRYLSREPENFIRNNYRSEPEFNSELGLQKTLKGKSNFTLLWIRSRKIGWGEWNYITQSIKHYWNRSTSFGVSVRRSESSYLSGKNTVRTSFSTAVKKEVRGSGSLEVRYDQVIRSSENEGLKKSNSMRITLKNKAGPLQIKSQVLLANASDYESRIILWDPQLFGYASFRSFSEPGIHYSITLSYKPRPFITLYCNANYSHSKANWILPNGIHQKRSQNHEGILGIKFSPQ